MSDTQNDATVNLIRAIVQNMSGPETGLENWESFTMIVDSFEGVFNSLGGYAYTPDGKSIAVTASPWKVIEFVDAYVAGYYKPGEPLPVKLLVQFYRPSGSYMITFEDADETRWKVTPKNFVELRNDLRPVVDKEGLLGAPRV